MLRCGYRNFFKITPTKLGGSQQELRHLKHKQTKVLPRFYLAHYDHAINFSVHVDFAQLTNRN